MCDDDCPNPLIQAKVIHVGKSSAGDDKSATLQGVCLADCLYICPMCGRATYKLTWEEIVALYRLTIGQPAVNTRLRQEAS
jgi:hypothetical protein